MKPRLLFLTLLISVAAFSQETVPSSAFASVDSFAKTIQYKGDLGALTHQLTEPYSQQLYRARAIFKWITENISYDWKYYNRYYYRGREPKGFECRDDADCAAKQMAWETKYIDGVVGRKKAVCEGYSMLFKRMCDIAGLQSRILPGYVRTEYYQVGSTGSLNHAWNAVYIDSAWRLLDVTWAAGGIIKDEDDKLLGFIKSFKPYYWLTPAEDFARNHYPQDTMWTLVPLYTKGKFTSNPYYRSADIPYLHLISPVSGIIHAKKDDTIRFTIEYRARVDAIQINSNVFRNPDIYTLERVRHRWVRRPDTVALKQQQYIPFRHKWSRYEFEYVVTDASLYYLDILFDRQQIMRFNVNIISADGK